MKKKILIVDDEKDIIEFVSDLLVDKGYEVDFANDGAEGFAKLEILNPDLILLDLQMPNATGVDMYRHMYKNKSTKSIPVIVVSGMPGADMALNARIPRLEKPIDEAKLLSQIESMIG